jgi:hypothetical protein
MANLAPGVEVFERSFSQRLEVTNQATFATLGLFRKGPVNERITLNNVEDLNAVFGTPDDVTYPFYFPVAKILDTAPVHLVRIEESTINCAGLTVGISGGVTNAWATPVQVLAYPLSYQTLFQPDDDLVTQIEFTGGETETITFCAVGPGPAYEAVSIVIVNNTDYPILQDLRTELADAITPAEKQAIGQAAYNLALSGSGGMALSLADDLIDPSDSYSVNDNLLETYLAFDNGPSNDSEFVLHEFEASALINSYLVSTDPESKDQFAKSNFVNKVVRELSANIRVFVSTSKLTAGNVTPQSIGKTALAGADALSEDLNGLTDEIYLNLNDNFTSKEDILFSAFVDIDFDLPVKQRMDEIANTRKDCIALLNVPSDRMINLVTEQKTRQTTTLVKDWVADDLNINSSYSAIYAQYFQVYDPFADENRWIPCTGHVAERMAFTFNNFEPWFAFAGLERGIVSGVLKVAYNPTDAQRKVLYPNRINPIVDFRGEGIVIFGQKTLQSFASSTDRINVRNLFIHIGREVATFSRVILFQPNDDLTRNLWLSQVQPFMASIQARRGVFDFRLICDTSNNPETVVARNEFVAFIMVKPTTTAEFIKIVIADVGGNLSFDEVLGGVQV